MKFEQAEKETVTAKEKNKKKKFWTKGDKSSTGITGVSSADTGVTGDYDKMKKGK